MPVISTILGSALGKSASDFFKALLPESDMLHRHWMTSANSANIWFQSTYGNKYGSKNNRFYDYKEIDEIIFQTCFFGEEANVHVIRELSERYTVQTPDSVIKEYITRLKKELSTDSLYNWLLNEFEHYRRSDVIAADLKELLNLFKKYLKKRQLTHDENMTINLDSYGKFIRDEHLILVDNLWEPDRAKLRQIGLFDVYIKRDIEDDIITTIEEDLKDEVKKWIPITGDAGFGKTTLLFSLWNLFDSKKHENGVIPIFIRSSDLFENDSALKVYAEMITEVDDISLISQYLNIQRILRATIQMIIDKNNKCILFLDTLDVVLKTKERILQIRNLIDQLSDIGATLVVTCRDFEFDSLRHIPRRRLFRLRYYSETRELPIVLKRYIDAFYQNRPFKWKEKQKGDLLKAVASRVLEDRDLAYVCRNPLTLKMLFLIYHPDQIPQNVDIRLLYDEFWRAKVMCNTDRRPLGKGDYLIPSDIALQKDQLACRIAFEMLVKGRLSLSMPELWSLVSTNLSPNDLLKGLLSENVLKQVGEGLDAETVSTTKGQGKIEFFHQTLYEYAAARYIIHLMPYNQGNVIDWMLQYILHNPSDTFRIPVVEQIALQFNKHQKKIVHSLLDSGSPIHAKLAVSICSRLRFEERTDEYTRKLLNNSKSVQKFLLQSINDFPTFRKDEVVYIFHEIWARGDHNLRDNILDVCIEMCTTKVDAVHQFLKMNDVWQYLSLLNDRSILGAIISRLVIPILTQMMGNYPLWVYAKLEFIMHILIRKKLMDEIIINFIDLLHNGLYNKHNSKTGLPVFEYDSILSLLNTLIDEPLSIDVKKKIGKIYANLPQSILNEKSKYLFKALISQSPKRASAAANIITEIITSSDFIIIKDDYFATLWDYFSKSLNENNQICAHIIADIAYSGLAATGHRQLWKNLIALLQSKQDIYIIHITSTIISKYKMPLSNNVSFWIDIFEAINDVPGALHRAISENIFTIIGNSHEIETAMVKSFLINKAKSGQDLTTALALRELRKVAGLDYHDFTFLNELSKWNNDIVKKALMQFLVHLYQSDNLNNNCEAREAIEKMMLSIADPSHTPKTNVQKHCIPSLLILANSSSVDHDKILDIAYRYGQSTKSDIRKSGSLIISKLLSKIKGDERRSEYFTNLFKLYGIGDLNNKVFLLRFLNDSLKEYHEENDIDIVLNKCRELIAVESDTAIIVSICWLLRTFANDAPAVVAKLVFTIIQRIHELKLTKEPVHHIIYCLVGIFITQMHMGNMNILEYSKAHLGNKVEIFERFISEIVGRFYPNNHILPLSELVQRDDLLLVTREKIHSLVSKSTQSDTSLENLYEVAGIRGQQVAIKI